MSDLGQKLDYGTRMLLPGLATVLLLFLFALPIGPAGIGYFPPHICLMSIYYWSLFHPAAFPLWLIFAVGLLQDTLLGAPLGLTSLLFIVFNRILLAQQRFALRESFWASWCGFALAGAVFFLVYWIAMSLYLSDIPPISTSIMQWVFTIALYPLAHAGFNVLHRYLPEHRSS